MSHLEQRLMFDYTGAMEPGMKKALTKEELRKHWYIVIMATALDRRRQGHASNLIRHMQDQAREGGHIIWLEATTSTSRDLYSQLGFELVGETVLGKGDVGPDGLAKKNGEGVPVWLMYWRP